MGATKISPGKTARESFGSSTQAVPSTTPGLAPRPWGTRQAATAVSKVLHGSCSAGPPVRSLDDIYRDLAKQEPGRFGADVERIQTFLLNAPVDRPAATAAEAENR